MFLSCQSRVCPCRCGLEARGQAQATRPAKFQDQRSQNLASRTLQPRVLNRCVLVYRITNQSTFSIVSCWRCDANGMVPPPKPTCLRCWYVSEWQMTKHEQTVWLRWLVCFILSSRWPEHRNAICFSNFWRGLRLHSRKFFLGACASWWW